MADLYVDPEAITRFAQAVGDPAGLSSDASRGQTYHSSWCRVPGGSSGIFANFTGIAEGAYAAVDEALTHLRTVLRDTGRELAASAEFYENTDHHTAAEMDRTYPA
ncbi:type VII secretion target [Pseudactinotalea sp. HY158]|uniref:type VII secretion target n=1 Tax=Pseudactinotalea sp. HY158 TaxID=2654547 RepID=UPI00129CB84A|nr:type VII secretion target [Pseudactinotalea sp. HY158]QGH69106.1 hypothetical protein GCE65_05990 [Pseudactinotalea sp. HY158]